MFYTRYTSISRTDLVDGRWSHLFFKTRPRSFSRTDLFSNGPHRRKAEPIIYKHGLALFLERNVSRKTPSWTEGEANIFFKNDLTPFFERIFYRKFLMARWQGQYLLKDNIAPFLELTTGTEGGSNIFKTMR